MTYKDVEDLRIFRILLISLTNECPVVDGYFGDRYCGYCGGRENQTVEHDKDCVWENAVSVLKEMGFKKTNKERKWWEGAKNVATKGA